MPPTSAVSVSDEEGTDRSWVPFGLLVAVCFGAFIALAALTATGTIGVDDDDLLAGGVTDGTSTGSSDTDGSDSDGTSPDPEVAGTSVTSGAPDTSTSTTLEAQPATTAEATATEPPTSTPPTSEPAPASTPEGTPDANLPDPEEPTEPGLVRVGIQLQAPAGATSPQRFGDAIAFQRLEVTTRTRAQGIVDLGPPRRSVVGDTCEGLEEWAGPLVTCDQEVIGEEAVPVPGTRRTFLVRVNGLVLAELLPGTWEASYSTAEANDDGCRWVVEQTIDVGAPSDADQTVDLVADEVCA